MKEVTLFVDEHDILHALLPNGERRSLLVDTYDSSCYGIVKLGEQPDADIVAKRSKKMQCKLIDDPGFYIKWEKKEE